MGSKSKKMKDSIKQKRQLHDSGDDLEHAKSKKHRSTRRRSSKHRSVAEPSFNRKTTRIKPQRSEACSSRSLIKKDKSLFTTITSDDSYTPTYNVSDGSIDYDSDASFDTIYEAHMKKKSKTTNGI